MRFTAEVLTSTDNCDDASSVSMTEEVTSQTCAGAYTLTRTWTATDCAGNATDHVQTITVIDTTAPVIDVAAADATVECDARVTPPTSTHGSPTTAALALPMRAAA